MNVNDDPYLDVEFIKTLTIEHAINKMLNYVPEKNLSEHVHGEFISCWVPLSKIEKTNFISWRNAETECHYDRYLSFKERSIQIEETKLAEAIKALNTLKKLYYTEYWNLSRGILPGDIYCLAKVCGIIDFIQKIYETKPDVKTSSLADYFLNSEIFNTKKEILTNNLTNCTPKNAALILHALVKLKYINRIVNISEIHEILTNEFGIRWTRQSLDAAMKAQEARTDEIDKKAKIFK
jgi:hypothetical protein